jgi:4-amino-4-deoxy-L-arabinose transferase-like glycosyltransferase
MTLTGRAGVWTRVGLLACLLLAALGLHHGLWTPDEPREAEIAREMALAPRVVPTLNEQRFIEKPPLYYWAVAGAFRLAGHPSADLARALSSLAGLLTLLSVYAWGVRAGRRDAGVVAVLLLATSVQFLVSTHWVLLDPLLMLFTTLAIWAGWERLNGRGWGWLALLYGALSLALWTKGLIGVVLVVFGMGSATLLGRHDWRRLRPLSGALLLAAMLALLGAAIYAEGGRDALWEWAWVNHVQRFTNPGATGHRQPVLYYLWTLPVALLPWLVPLFDAVRSVVRRESAADAALQRYCALLVGAMLLVLSAAATKRETYLLPLLPPLGLWLGLRIADWYHAWHAAGETALGWRWWTQGALLALYALAPGAAALIYLRRADPLALLALLAAATLIGIGVSATWRGRRALAARAALGCAALAAAALLVLVPRSIDVEKNMAPFVRWVDTQLPAGEPVYALNVDETLRGVVPFETGRRLLSYEPTTAAAAVPPPTWLLHQDVRKGARTPVPAGYVLERRARFGPGRALSLWRRAAPAH